MTLAEYDRAMQELDFDFLTLEDIVLRGREELLARVKVLQAEKQKLDNCDALHAHL